MRADICKWCSGCLVCATHQPSKATHTPLNPIPVEGPFHRMGVNVIQYHKSQSGNQYAVVFIDYLTKWPEIFASYTVGSDCFNYCRIVCGRDYFSPWHP